MAGAGGGALRCSASVTHWMDHSLLLVPPATNIPQCLLELVAPGANLTAANLTIANFTAVNGTVLPLVNATNATTANATDPKVTASGLTDTPAGEPACTCNAHSSGVSCPLAHTIQLLIPTCAPPTQPSPNPAAKSISIPSLT